MGDILATPSQPVPRALPQCTANVAYGSKADKPSRAKIHRCPHWSKSGQTRAQLVCPLSAMNGQTQRNMIGAKRKTASARRSLRNPIRCLVQAAIGETNHSICFDIRYASCKGAIAQHVRLAKIRPKIWTEWIGRATWHYKKESLKPTYRVDWEGGGAARLVLFQNPTRIVGAPRACTTKLF